MKTSIKIIGAISAIPTNKVDVFGNREIITRAIVELNELNVCGVKMRAYCEVEVRSSSATDSKYLIREVVNGRRSIASLLRLGNDVSVIKYKPAANRFARRGIPIEDVPMFYVFEAEGSHGLEKILGICRPDDKLKAYSDNEDDDVVIPVL